MVRVIRPTAEMTVTPEDVVNFEFEAHDDHGIARAELVVYEESPIAGEAPSILSVQEIPLGDQQLSRHVAAAAQLDLSQLDVSEGANIAYAVRVTDNRRLQLARPQTQRSADVQGNLAANEQSKPDGDPTAPAGAPSKSNEVNKDTTQTTAENRPQAAKSPQKDKTASGEPAKDAASKQKPDGLANNVEAKGGANDDALQAKQTAPSAAASGNKKPARETNKSRLADASKDDPENDHPPLVAQAPNDDPLANGESKTDPQDKTRIASNAAPSTADSPSAALEQDPSRESSAAEGQADLPSKAESLASEEEQRPTPQKSVAQPNGPTQPQADPSSVANPAKNNGQRTASMADASAQRPIAKAAEESQAQNAESNRLRLRVAQRLVSAAQDSDEPGSARMKIRERLQQMDRELKPCESALQTLVETAGQSGIGDPQIEQLRGVDARLERVDRIIADLRKESKDTPYAFAGLQMMEIGRAQITPARSGVYGNAPAWRRRRGQPGRSAAPREPRPGAAGRTPARYERVVREQALADSLEEAVKIYEVYIANTQRLMRRQSKPSANPLQRKMAIVEVDQAYLDRLREVLEMRQDLMAEFARILGDDPRLLGKYMDIIKRRRTSLRDTLAELHERQTIAATELQGWRKADPTQREDVWLLAVELRLRESAPLAVEASELEERTVSQFPLSQDTTYGAPAAVIGAVRQIALRARSAASKARRLMRNPYDERIDLVADVDDLTLLMVEFDAALEQLQHDKSDDEIGEFVTNRLSESRALAERVIAWAETAAHIQNKRFDKLVLVDQRRLAARTEQLRLAMQDIDGDLNGQFRGQAPAETLDMARRLQDLLEAITFNQTAATFELDRGELANGEAQQSLALRRFEEAEALFDEMRRTIVEEADKENPENPDVADLVDPTLDEFLARLEREPNLNALLGIPNRPRNLKIMSDWMLWDEERGTAPTALAQSVRRARRRAEEEQTRARAAPTSNDKDDDMNDEQWRQIASAEEAEEKLQEKIDALRRKAKDPRTDKEQAEKLRKLAKQLEAMRKQLADRDIDERTWREMVRSDQMRAVLKAAASGEPMPDTQWNRLLSSLGAGLWQASSRTPPEDYRQAIEQYQEQIRRLINQEAIDAAQP